MRQVLQSYRSGELWLAEVDPPRPAPRGARVESRASLLSAGTERQLMELAQKSLVGKATARPDLVRQVLRKVQQEGFLPTLQKVREKLNVPLPMGYSCAGVVLDADDAHGLVPGQRVACAGMGFASHAECNWIPRNLMVRLPDEVSFEEGAFATLGAIALQGVRQAEIRLGDRVVVVGLGLIGNLCAQLARASGARVLGFDLSEGRAALGARVGCDRVCTHPERVVEEVLAFSSGQGADAVLLAASAPGDDGPLELSMELSRMRGRVVVVGLVGMQIPRNLAYEKELEVRMSMSYGPGRYDPDYEERGQDYPYPYVRYTEQRNMQAFLEAIADGAVEVAPLISHRYDIDDALDAYGLLDGDEPYLGIILRYGEGRGAEEQAPVEALAPARPSAPQVQRVPGRIGIGVLGAGGYFSGTLLPALARADVRRVGVVNRTGASAERVASSAGFAWSSTDQDRLLADPDIHAVFVGTRHRLHAPLVLAALEAGKHVFVEKPLCLTDGELADIVAAQERSGCYVQVGTNRRHSPYTRALRSHFDRRSDPLCLTVRINAGRLPESHWLRDPAEGGGRLVGEGVHFVDWAQAVVGAPIGRVTTTAMGSGPTALAGDTFAIALQFSDGSLAQILYAADGDSGLEKEHYEVFGLGMAARIENFTSGFLWRGGRRRRLRRSWSQEKGVAEEIEAFLTTLRTGRPAVPLDVTWHVQHATLRAAESLARGVPLEVAWPRPGADR